MFRTRKSNQPLAASSTFEAARGARARLATCLLVACALIGLSACSLYEHFLDQGSENRGDPSPKQDPGVSSGFQGGNPPSQPGLADSSSWVLSPLDQLPVVGGESSEIIGIFTPLRPPAGGRNSGNKDTILVVAKSGNVLLMHIPSGHLYRLMQLPENISQVAFFPDSALLATVHQHIVEVYSLSSGRPLFSLDRLQTRLNSVAFHPNGRSLVLGASDGRVYRWKFGERPSTGGENEEYKVLERYYGHASVVSSVAPHPFGRIFFSGDWSGTLSAFLLFDRDLFLGEYDPDYFGGRYLSKITPRANAPRPDTVSIVKIAVGHTGKELYVALQDGRVELWEVRGFEKRAEGAIHKGLIYDMVTNADSTKIASAGRDGRVVVWSFVPNADPKLAPAAVVDYEVRSPMVSKLVFLEDGKLYAGSAGGQVFEVKRP